MFRECDIERMDDESVVGMFGWLNQVARDSKTPEDQQAASKAIEQFRNEIIRRLAKGRYGNETV